MAEQTTVTADFDSDYVVDIPASLELGTGLGAEAELKVGFSSVYLEHGQTLTIAVVGEGTSGAFQLHATKDEKTTWALKITKGEDKVAPNAAVFEANVAHNNKDTAYETLTVATVGTPAKAGAYTGTLTFIITDSLASTQG